MAQRLTMAPGASARAVFPRYFLASGAALAVDMAGFLLALRAEMPAMTASTLAYTLGIGVHWWLSSRAEFAGDIAPKGRARRRQQALFMVSALVGLALTAVIVGNAARAGIDPRAGKLVAVAVSYLATWGLRRHVVFARKK